MCHKDSGPNNFKLHMAKFGPIYQSSRLPEALPIQNLIHTSCVNVMRLTYIATVAMERINPIG